MYNKIIILIFISIFLYNCQSKLEVNKGNKVYLKYKIKDIDGCRIDESFLHNNWNSKDKNEIFTFTVGNGEVIEGWDSVIIGCKKNKLYSFEIPYQQAYGEEEIYHDIPAKSNLLLTFKIIKIE